MKTISLPSASERSLDIDPAFVHLIRGPGIAKASFPFGDECWIVTDYRAVRQIYSDDAFTRVIEPPAAAPRTTRLVIAGPETIGGADRGGDNAARRVMRKLLCKESVDALYPMVLRRTEELLDSIERSADPAFDMVADFTDRLPMDVLCHMLGVPATDGDYLRATIAAVFADGNAVDETVAEGSLIELVEYVAELIRRPPVVPATDSMSQLALLADAERLSKAEQLHVGMGLILAGYETTAVALPKLIYYLLGRYGRLNEAPLEDGSRYVDELLRVVALGGGETLPWMVRKPVDICGQRLGPGEFVVPIIGAANLDPSVFAEPNAFDPCRKRLPHMSFGSGDRYCLGSAIARSEISAAVSGLLNRFPNLHLEHSDASATWRFGHALWALESLIVVKG